jgi:hypothetical protein
VQAPQPIGICHIPPTRKITLYVILPQSQFTTFWRRKMRLTRRRERRTSPTWLVYRSTHHANTALCTALNNNIITVSHYISQAQCIGHADGCACAYFFAFHPFEDVPGMQTMSIVHIGDCIRDRLQRRTKRSAGKEAENDPTPALESSSGFQTGSTRSHRGPGIGAKHHVTYPQRTSTLTIFPIMLPPKVYGDRAVSLVQAS